MWQRKGLHQKQLYKLKYPKTNIFTVYKMLLYFHYFLTNTMYRESKVIGKNFEGEFSTKILVLSFQISGLKEMSVYMCVVVVV